MRIGLDISDLATNRADGTTRFTRELAQRLPQLSPQHTWQFFTPAASAAVAKVITASNVQPVIAPFPKYWTQLRLPFELYRHRPDVLFMPIQQLPYLRPRAIKTVAVIHDLAFHKFPQQFTYKDWALLHLFTAYAAQHADRIIAVSQSTARDIAHFYGREKDVHVVHHGVDHAKFYLPDGTEKAAAWEKLHHTYPTLRRPYLLFVGQIQPRKNIVRLLEAFEQLRRDHADLQLVIAGAHGWLQQPILQRISRSSAREHIILAGRVPDDLLPALYWHAEVFVLPSLYEGFGMPILEAQASGCPVVTSNASSLPEVAGDAAVLVDPSNTQAIAQGITMALAQRTSIARRGSENARKFSWEYTAAQTLAIVEKW